MPSVDLDLEDDVLFDAFATAYRRSNSAPTDDPWTAAELRVKLRGDGYGFTERVVILDDGDVVAGGWAELWVRDNLDAAVVEVFCVPERRREGFGSQILAVLSRKVLDHGRSRLFAAAVRPADALTSAGAEFARCHGFTRDTTNARRELPLPAHVDVPVVVDGYLLTSWRGVPPDHLIDEYATLRAQLNSQAPSGGAVWEDEYWDADRLRGEVSGWEEAGREAQTVVAISPDGQLAGHTQLVIPRAGATCYQWDTLVLPEHRGHGLGLALKQQAMIETGTILAQKRRIITMNDSSNAPMIRINVQLGYRLTAYHDEFAKNLAGKA